jgi:hypothetical protein
MARRTQGDPIEQLRTLCLALPEVTERLSHSEPTWFIGGKKTLAMLDDHHHGADHLAVWIPAALGVQAEMIEADPEQFFRPPYVGPRGWVGVRIDRNPDWDEIDAMLHDAYRLVAPAKLRKLLDN